MNKSIQDDLKFHFVMKDLGVSDDLQIAFETGNEYFAHSKSIQRITEQKCLKLNKNELLKKHIFVIEEFGGEIFDFLKDTKALILGPRCFMSCLQDDTPIPLGSTPVYTTAMTNLVVSASGLNPAEKSRISDLVSWMGGHYIQNINMACTHLISNTVKSTKYEKAAETKIIKIMHPDWIDELWKLSKKTNITATDPCFDKHQLKIFYNLNITVTNLDAETKSKIKMLVDGNGGKFVGAFRSQITDILVLNQESVHTEKYKAAIHYKKDCVTPTWIFDSIEKGYALAMKNYRVNENPRISTPNKTGLNPKFLDCSQLSEISYVNKAFATQVNETVASDMSVKSMRSTRSSAATIPKYQEIIASLNIQQAKRAGPFLDGYYVYLCGFTIKEKDKLNKIIINVSGIRYDELNSKITHIIIGDENCEEINLIKNSYKNCFLLKLEWLQMCIKQKKLIDETAYVIKTSNDAAILKNNQNDPEPPSPSSKKLMGPMSSSFKRPDIPKFYIDAAEPNDINIEDVQKEKSLSIENVNTMNKSEENNEINLIEQYLKKNNTPSVLVEQEKPTDSTATSKGKSFETIVQANNQNSKTSDSITLINNESEEAGTCFNNIRVCFYGFDDEIEKQLEDDCKLCGADIVNDSFTVDVDYLIVPIIIQNAVSTEYKAKHVVNDLWIDDVIQTQELVDIAYYHKPFLCEESFKPLEGLVLVISKYTENEKIFIKELGSALGAEVKEVYNRNRKPILICPLPEGQKYEGSVKWNLPSVTSKWLVKCCEEKQKLPFDDFIVGKECEDVSYIIPSTQKSFGAVQSSSSEGSTLKNNTKLPKRKSDEQADENNENISNNKNQKTTHEFKLKEKISAGTSSSPNTLKNSDELSPASRRVQIFDTPIRQILYQGWKEKEEQDKKDALLQTPGRIKPISPTIPILPENVRTPDHTWGLFPDSTPESRDVLRRKLMVVQHYCKPEKVRTPPISFNEVKKMFWKDVLGDMYVDDDEGNTQTQFTQKLEVPMETQFSTQQTSAEHVRELRDFIQNQQVEQRMFSYQNDDDVDSIPFKANSEAMGTENEMIGWRDPNEFNTLRRNTKEPMKYSGVPKFIISCMEVPTKERVIEQIKKLKGEVCDQNLKYDPSGTHVICEQLNRGEKICSSIASGKWILSLSYVQDSIDAGFFLNEELYEWGNSKATSLPSLEQTEQKIANAAHRWRIKIATQPEKKTGVFTGFRVVLHVDVAKKDQFQCVIKAGGGVVIDVEPPYEKSDEALSATHCLVESKRKKLSKDDYQAFVDSGVSVLSVMYLNAYLLETPADVDKFRINYT